MPNHIKNRITLTGTEKDIKVMLDLFSTSYPAEVNKASDGRIIYQDKSEQYKYGWYDESSDEFETRNNGKQLGIPKGYQVDINPAWVRFPDFNKIIPMPESLHLETHFGVETAIEKALNMDYHDNELARMLEIQNRAKAESPLKLNDEDWDKFIIGLNNVRKHGFIGWYQWSIENWGTKWNAYACKKLFDNVFEFDTAWSPVPKLIERLSIANPNVSILYEWSDEDTGSNCGYANYFNGQKDLKEIENQSKEAFEMAFKLRPDYAERYELINGEYVCKEE